MKKLLITLILLTAISASMLFISSYAFADGYTVTSIRQFDYVSGSGGYSGTGTRIGQFYYYNDNR